MHRRLRARWFSLVPVRLRAMVAVSAILIATAILLCFAHYAAVSWPSIAYRPEVARPLRLDRPDSFGHCMMVALLTASTGASLLIYQLRRYRNDDFKGHYRLWRLVMIVMVLASINAMVGVMDWGGAILDSIFGKRVALTGGNWVRLVVSLGGAVLAIRLIAEVRRCRSSLGLMIAACLLLAIPEAAKWNTLEVDSLSRWILVTSAPLFACTALFLSLGTYLRMLYREVRQIADGEPLLDRLRQFQANLFQRTETDQDDQEDARVKTSKQEVAGEPEQASRRWWQWRTPSKQSAAEARAGSNKKKTTEVEVEAYEEEDSDDAEESVPVNTANKNKSVEPREPKAKSKRRWFGLRSAKPEPTQTGDDDRNQREQPAAATAVSAQKKSRFSLRLKPVAASASPATSSDEQDTEAESEPASAKKRSSGLGWFRRGKSSASDHRVESSSGDHEESDSDNEIDADDIDWNAMNKTERRRLRKQLKRQNRAA